MWNLFGLCEDKILAKNCCTKATVTKVYECWWLSVKTKAIRICNTRENTRHPHIITFTYIADGTSYTGKRFIPLRFRVPRLGEEFDVYYDPAKPKNYAMYSFGPENFQISW